MAPGHILVLDLSAQGITSLLAGRDPIRSGTRMERTQSTGLGRGSDGIAFLKVHAKLPSFQPQAKVGSKNMNLQHLTNLFYPVNALFYPAMHVALDWPKAFASRAFNL